MPYAIIRLFGRLTDNRVGEVVAVIDDTHESLNLVHANDIAAELGLGDGGTYIIANYNSTQADNTYVRKGKRR